jgi:hypothetical protein
MCVRLRLPKWKSAEVEICGTEFRMKHDLWASPLKKTYDMLWQRQICKTAGINLRNAFTCCE